MKITIFIVLSSLGTFLQMGCASSGNNNITSEGTKLIIAINQFYSDEGFLPKTLSDLANKYIEQVPKLDIGGKTFYYSAVSNKNKQFRLSFRTKPTGLMALGAKSLEYWVYDPWGLYINKDNIKILNSTTTKWYHIVHHKR